MSESRRAGTRRHVCLTLRVARLACGYSAREAALKVSIARTSLRSYELGTRSVPAEILYEFAIAYGVLVEDFFNTANKTLPNTYPLLIDIPNFMGKENKDE